MESFLIKTMKKEDIVKLIDACGELARGLKKIKTTLTRSLSGLSGQIRPEEIPGSEVPGGIPKGTRSLSGGRSDNRDNLSRDWVVQVTPKEFLLHTKLRWGCSSSLEFIKIVVGETVRSDVFKSAWVKDDTKKNGWRKISKRKYAEILKKCKTFMALCQDIVIENKSYTAFCKNVGNIHRGKWHRHKQITDMVLTERELRKFTRENHDDLPPLRGHKLKK